MPENVPPGATSSSSAAATTDWSPRSTWLRRDSSPLSSNVATQVGGAAITDEFHPGFRCSTLAHTSGPIRPEIVRDMQLEKHGLRVITPETCVTALSPDGRALSLYQDENKSAQAIAAFSQKDAVKYPEFENRWPKSAK
jgi:phytoene dehydrogenase-like protein